MSEKQRFGLFQAMVALKWHYRVTEQWTKYMTMVERVGAFNISKNEEV